MRDPSRVCNLHHSLWQCWILNPLSKARDWTHIFMDSSWVHYLWATRELPGKMILIFIWKNKWEVSIEIFGKKNEKQEQWNVLPDVKPYYKSLAIKIIQYRPGNKQTNITGCISLCVCVCVYCIVYKWTRLLFILGCIYMCVYTHKHIQV